MRSVVLVLLAIAASLVVVRIAQNTWTGTDKCPAGMISLGPRCCAEGQRLRDGHCTGRPGRCPAGMRVTEKPTPGCAAEPRRVAFSGGLVRIGPQDWEAEGVIEPHQAKVEPFDLDALEVTVERWATCVAAGVCSPVEQTEPGHPVTSVTPAQAARCCAFMGGRLPTRNEWLMAATGTEQRRYPWGMTGLVCRRAAFGLVRGPCAEAGTSPEVAGARPEGATPEGILDLSGNVAEWLEDEKGTFSAWGGSYVSRRASELKGWAKERPSGPSPHVGFRCAYRASKAVQSASINPAGSQEGLP